MWLHVPPSAASPFAPASACSMKAQRRDSIISASITAPWLTLSGTPTQRPLSWHGWKARPWLRLLSGTISRPSLAGRSAAAWIASLPASPVRTSALRDRVRASAASAAACSSTASTSQRLAERGSSGWRTSQASLVPELPLWTKPSANSPNAPPPASWENWPTAGGLRNGCIFGRPQSALPTDESDGSALRGAWPTPNAMPEAPNASMNRGRGQLRARATDQCLGTVAAATASRVAKAHAISRSAVPAHAASVLWPTPTAQSDQGPVDSVRQGGSNLVSKVALWPTATARDGDPRRNPTKLDGKAWAKKKARDAVNASGLPSDDLSSAAAMWPTPDCNTSSYSNGTMGPNLRESASQWPTPAVRDFRSDESQMTDSALYGTKGKPLSRTAERWPPGGMTSSPPAPVISVDGIELSPTENSISERRRLNPEFVEWLMGWPIGWTSTEPTACDAAAMVLWRSRLRQHLSCLFDEPESLERSE